MIKSDFHLLITPVQWRAQSGSGQSRLQAARRRSSAAGCSPLRRCPRPEKSFTGLKDGDSFGGGPLQEGDQIPPNTVEIGNVSGGRFLGMLDTYVLGGVKGQEGGDS